jgi:hypothetical protein
MALALALTGAHLDAALLGLLAIAAALLILGEALNACTDPK